MTYHHYLYLLVKSIIDYEAGQFLEYRHLIKCDEHKNTWVKCFANAAGRLEQGVGYILKWNEAIFSWHMKITNRQEKGHCLWPIFCNYIPQKGGTHWTILVAGVNLIIFSRQCHYKNSLYNHRKLLFNINISVHNAWFLCCYIKIIHMDTNVYIRIHPYSFKLTTRINNSTIWPNQDITQWIHLCRYKESYSQPTTGRTNRKYSPYKEPRTT